MRNSMIVKPCHHLCLLISLTVCLGAFQPATAAGESSAAESNHKPVKAADKEAKSASEKAGKSSGKDSLSDSQRRHQDEGYYSSAKTKKNGEWMSDIQHRYKD